MRQNSKLKKKDFFILKIWRYVEKLQKIWNCVFWKFQQALLKWAPTPKEQPLKSQPPPKKRQNSKFTIKNFCLFFLLMWFLRNSSGQNVVLNSTTDYMISSLSHVTKKTSILLKTDLLLKQPEKSRSSLINRMNRSLKSAWRAHS